MRTLAACLVLGLSGCASMSTVSDTQLETAIRASFSDIGCKMQGKTASEAEAPFEAALAKRLGVPVAQVSDREGDIFKRGDRIVGDMVKRGEILLEDDSYNATVVNCTPAAA